MGDIIVKHTVPDLNDRAVVYCYTWSAVNLLDLQRSDDLIFVYANSYDVKFIKKYVNKFALWRLWK